MIPVVVATIATHLFVPESPVRVPGRVNWAGAALMSLGLTAVLVAVSETANWHWLSWKTLGCIGAGLVLLTLWVRSESRSKEPLVDMRMMRIRGVWTTNTVALLLGFGMYASFILLPQFVESPGKAGYGFNASVTQAGLFLVPTTVAMLLVGSQTGRLERLLGSKPLLLAGAMLALASFAVLAFARAERWEIYVAAALLGSGIGLAFAAMANLIIENVGPEQTGVATGMNTVIDPLCRNYCPIEAQRLNDVVNALPRGAKPAIVAISVNVYGNAHSILMEDAQKWKLVPQWQWAIGQPAESAT